MYEDTAGTYMRHIFCEAAYRHNHQTDTRSTCAESKLNKFEQIEPYKACCFFRVEQRITHENRCSHKYKTSDEKNCLRFILFQYQSGNDNSNDDGKY